MSKAVCTLYLVGGNMVQKKFCDLDLSNSFLFAAALEDAVTCKLVLECILGHPVSNVKVHSEYNMMLNSDFKCIRLDIMAKDELEVTYDLEMQNQDEHNLPKRSRYYQAELDVFHLKPGEDYKALKPLYIIFICNFDPFGAGRYCYTFEMQCKEGNILLGDEVKRIFLNTQGEKPEEVSQTLVEFLGYINDSSDSYVEKVNEPVVKELHERVKSLKKSRVMEERFMHFEELLKHEKEVGRADILKLIQLMVENGEQDSIPNLYADSEFLKKKLEQYLQ